MTFDCRALARVGRASLWLILAAMLRGQAPQTPVRDAAPALMPQSTATLTGTLVTDDASQTPVRRARVTLNSEDRSVGRTTTTDDVGRFAFADLPSGRFIVRATKPAYLDAVYGGSRPGRPGTAIALAAGQQLAGVLLRMARGGVITGRVLDPDGQPATGISVVMLRSGHSTLTGERTLGLPVSSARQSTDDDGTYRAYGLPPGDYIVVALAPGVSPLAFGNDGLEIRRPSVADVEQAIAAARAGAAPGSTGRSAPTPGASATTRVVRYAPVYYPGTTDSSAATTIAIGVAEERSGVDLQVQLVQVATVDGVVTIQPGAMRSVVDVTLTPQGDSGLADAGVGLSGPRVVRADAAGAFAFSGVAPGRYTVLARTAGAGRRGGPPREAAPTDIVWASSTIDVDGHDAHVTLDLQPALTVTGRVVFDGTAAQPSPADLGRLRVSLQPVSSGARIDGPSSTPDAGGRLQITGVVPGRYSVLLISSGAFRGWALKSATAGGRDVLAEPFVVNLGDHVSDLTVTYTDHPSVLRGRLLDLGGRPATDYFIVVFSTDRSQWGPRSLRVRSVRPGSDGIFTVPNLPAGNYRLVALTDLAPDDLYDPAFLDALVSKAYAFSIADGEQKTQDLKIGGAPLT